MNRDGSYLLSMLIVCAMYRSFREQAIEYVKQAAQEDSAGNYAKAFPLYMNALEYFKTYAKYENNYKIREAVMQKANEYLRRAEEIRVVLMSSCRPRYKPTSGDHAAMPKGGEGRGWQLGTC
ncbi:putative vesicle-fusing ATPase [Helianthus anomalus]